MAANVSTFRVQQVLSAWEQAKRRDDKAAQRCTALFCVFGELTPDTVENQRGHAMVQYLLTSSDPVSNVAVILAPSEVLFIVPDGSALPGVAAPLEAVKIAAVHLHAAEEAVAAVLRATSAEPPVMGRVRREIEIQTGAFAQSACSLLDRLVSADNLEEVGPLIGELLFVKDSAAVESVEKAASLCNAVFRRFARGYIEEQLRKSNPKPLNIIRDELCAKLAAPNTISGLEALDKTQFSPTPGLTTSIMHRGTYTAQIQSADTSADRLRGDVVVVRYGEKHFGHSAFFARTLIVSSHAPATAAVSYSFLYRVSDKVMELLTVGTKLCDVYQRAMEFARAENADLANCLMKTLGFMTGLLVLETRGSISERGIATIEDGMCFVVRIVLERVPDGEGTDGTYDMELADTVIIRNGRAEIKTKAFRKPEEIVYEIEDNKSEGSNGVDSPAGADRDLSKITRHGKSDVPQISRAEERELRLRELLTELHAEYLSEGGKARTQNQSEELKVTDPGRISSGELVPYSTAAAIPKQASDCNIFVDMEKMTVWLPVLGAPCAFHVSTISKVDAKAESSRTVMTVVFHSMQEAYVGYRLNNTKVFLKELTYASPRDVFTEIVIAIRTLQQKAKNMESERRRNVGSAPNARLLIAPSCRSLPQVKIRPPAVVTGRQNRGCIGNLELHQNGLRFSYIGGPGIEILFENIKHAIFQPSVNSISVIYHLVLKKGIEIGRKTWDQVQFIAEVMESSEAISGVRQSVEEEQAAEERDSARVSQTNKQFMLFAQEVQKASNIKVQIPALRFSFDGVHSRAMTTFKASKEVLWAISDWPPFAVSVEDIEVVSFERVVPGGMEIDMSLISKDYNKSAVTLTAIPRSSLDMIKDWCLSSRLYYMEMQVNPNWRTTLKEIREDPDWLPFLPGAGWSILNNDAGEDDEEESDDDDDDDSYLEEDEESDGSDSSWLSDDESNSSSNSDDDSSAESALSWDELERRAEAHDRKRGFSDDEDDDRARKKSRQDPPRQGSAAPSHSIAAAKAPAKFVAKSSVPPPRRF